MEYSVAFVFAVLISASTCQQSCYTGQTNYGINPYNQQYQYSNQQNCAQPSCCQPACPKPACPSYCQETQCPKPVYKVCVDHCGPEPCPSPPVQLPCAQAPPVEKSPICLPACIPPPKTISASASCVKTVLKHQPYEQLVHVPIVNKYIQTVAKPVTEVITFDAIPVCPQKCSCSCYTSPPPCSCQPTCSSCCTPQLTCQQSCFTPPPCPQPCYTSPPCPQPCYTPPPCPQPCYTPPPCPQPCYSCQQSGSCGYC